MQSTWYRGFEQTPMERIQLRPFRNYEDCYITGLLAVRNKIFRLLRIKFRLYHVDYFTRSRDTIL